MEKHYASLDTDDTQYIVIDEEVSFLHNLEYYFEAFVQDTDVEFTNCKEEYFPVIKNLVNSYNIVSITLPKNVTVIEHEAFRDFGNLTSIELTGARLIGGRAFYDCTRLIKANLPEVEIIGDEAFCFLQSLSEVNMPKVKKIGDDAFRFCNIKKLEIEKVEIIGEYAFSGLKYLKEVKFPSIKILKYNAFDSCRELHELLLGKDMVVDKGTDEVFTGCGYLEKIHISQNTVNQIKELYSKDPYEYFGFHEDAKWELDIEINIY
jgi:hypothetical protein